MAEHLVLLRRWYRKRLIPWGPPARKAFHMASPAFLVYYVMPPDAWTFGLLTRELVVLLVLAFFAGSEVLRLGLGLQVFGFRDYEARQLSAFTWAALGLTLALLLFPMAFVIPSLLTVAWVDPLCGLSRRRHWYPELPLVGAVVLIVACLAIEAAVGFLGWSLPWLLIAGVLAGTAAVGAEAPRLRWVDDDFRMLMVPLLLLTLAGVAPLNA